MTLNKLTAISSVDGRYNDISEVLSPYLSEYGLMKYRLLIEVEWFIYLSSKKEISELPTLSKEELSYLYSIHLNFGIKEAKKVKTIENKINHDVKAIEYYLRQKFDALPNLRKRKEFIHFGCTSEDINNLAYSLLIKDACNEVIIPKLKEIKRNIKKKAHSYARIPMKSRTHGQSATPTTMGKELANFVYRIDLVINSIQSCKLKGKMNGAVGNFNAHLIAFPTLDWLNISKVFVKSLKLDFSEYTTQVEPKDSLAEFLHCFVRMNNILLDFSQDCWLYISLGYFTQKLKVGEVGSSTMPHKVNPIDFENAEGNLGLSNALFNHIGNKVIISRFQRDLSDSTVLRNLGNAFALSLIAYEALIKGINKIDVDKNKIHDDLDNSWELLTEVIQTVMRKYNIPNGYEIMKVFSRGKSLDEKDIQSFINQLDIPKKDKTVLLDMTPLKYTGIAQNLAKKI